MFLKPRGFMAFAINAI